MNTQNTQCSVARLQSALSGNLPADEETALHEHLEFCDECSTALDRMAGGPAWCREASSLLSEDQFDDSLPSREEWSEVDFTVEHLEPSDEPGVLGRLGGYDVLEIIGHGGMGVVLKAYDRELKRTVAIKVLAPHLARNSLARKRFAREAQAAAAVVHPHVLAIHQVQASGRLPFLVMPLVPGESLAERLAARGTLELNEILRIGMQAAAGLAAAHEQGLVHRDVKPANILLERGVERAVLTDFGLARAADDVTLTRWGVVAGTPQYMSPEQARGEPLDGRSDLFSLGCVLYEMATGVSPFRTDSPLATMRRLVDESPQPIEANNPELPPWFVAIVHRLLEKDPSRRFQSAAEVSELLENCLAHLQHPAAVPLPAELRSADQPDRAGGRFTANQPDRASGRFRGPRKLLAGAALALPLLVAGVVIVLETNKGTLTIESEADDVAVRITEDNEVVERLTVTRGKNDVRIAAGEYKVEIDGKYDSIAIKDGNVTIHRGEKEIVKIVQRDAAIAAAPERIEMTVGGIETITHNQPISFVNVKNPDMLQLTALAPNRFRIDAKKPGVTQIELRNNDDKAHTIDVRVLPANQTQNPRTASAPSAHDDIADDGHTTSDATFEVFLAEMEGRHGKEYPMAERQGWWQRWLPRLVKELNETKDLDRRRSIASSAIGIANALEDFNKAGELLEQLVFLSRSEKEAARWQAELDGLHRRIAQRVAVAIEQLKSKYPHLENFSAAQHLEKNDERRSGRPYLPYGRQSLLYSVRYEKGVLSRGGRGGAWLDVDEQSGVSLRVNFFKRNPREAGRGYRMADLHVLVYVFGPVRESLHREIDGILKSLGASIDDDRNEEQAKLSDSEPSASTHGADSIDSSGPIAKQVAERIEDLKGKYPHLANFSAADHLKTNPTGATELTPPPKNPPLYVIHYRNGVVTRNEAVARDAEKYTFGPGDSAFNRVNGIDLVIYFFKPSPDEEYGGMFYDFGDFRARVRVESATAIRREIHEILKSLGARIVQTHADQTGDLAHQLAERIENLRSKFPHLENFSADEHLKKNGVRNDFAPGTPSNPELYSISYSNGVLATEPPPKSGPRRSPNVEFDPQTGIQLNIHFFKGDSRGADPRPPYRIGDLSIHVYVKGPAAEAIRKEILMILEKLGAEHTAPAGTEAPLPLGPWPTLPPQPSEADGPTGDPSPPSTPTTPQPFPANAANPPDALDLAPEQAVHHLVWGETKNGLQAGIAFLSTHKHVYEMGEQVPIAVRLRNVSSEPKTIKYTSARLRFAQPQIEGPKGERVQVIMPPRVRYVFPTIETSLKPGQEITFAVVQLQLAAEKPTQVSTPHIVASPGEYRITYTVPLMERDSREWPVTGTLRFEVTDKKAHSKALEFSEPRELVLSMNSMHYMLDLDTGKTIDPPARADRPEIAQMDVHATQMQPYQLPTGLSGAPSFFIPGQPMRGMKVKSSQWNASAAEVRRALAGDDVPPLTEMEYKPLEPATYFFKTEAGADGILELMALVEEPKGIRIRYKTITSDNAKEAKKSSRTAADKLQTSDLFELRLASRQPTDGWTEAAVADTEEIIYVSNKPVATSADVSSAEAIEDPAGQPALQITFNTEAAARLGHATNLYRGQPLAIVVEGKVLAAPVIRDPITTKAVMVGNLGPAETKRLAEMISAKTRPTTRFQREETIETIAISHDGKLIAIANGNPTFILQTTGTSRLKDDWKPSVEILDAETRASIVSLKLSTAEEDAVLDATESVFHFEVTALAFSPLEDVVAVGTSIGQAKFFNAKTGELVRMLDDEKPRLADKEAPENWKPMKRAIGRVESLAFSPDGSLLAVCGSSFTDFSDIFDRIERGGLGRHVSGPGRLKVFDAKTGELKHDLSGHSQVFDVAFSSDGSMLASVGRWEDASGHGNGVLVWNPQTGEKMRAVQIDANGGTHYVAFAPNKKLIVTGSVRFDKENDTRSTSIALTYPLSGITEWTQTVPGWSKAAFTRDGQSIVILCGQESIRVVNAETGQLKHELKAADVLPGGHWNDFAIGPQSNLILAGVTAERRGIVEIREVDARRAMPR